jgi:cellulose synthase (UDP-forming)
VAVLVVAAVVGTVRMAVADASVLGTVTNLVWVAFDLAVLGVVVQAVRYRGPEPTEGART